MHTPVPTGAQACIVVLENRSVMLVTHTLPPPPQLAVVAQVSPGVQTDASPQYVAPSAKVKQNPQFSGQTSSHRAHVPAGVQAWMGSQHVPPQQSFGAAHPGAGLSLGIASHCAVAELQLWQAGQTRGQTGGTQLPPRQSPPGQGVPSGFLALHLARPTKPSVPPSKEASAVLRERAAIRERERLSKRSASMEHALSRR